MKTLAKNQIGAITYTGFYIEDNGKFIVKTKGTWTYVNFQENEFTNIIWGYVVKQDNGTYKAFQFGDRNVKYFDSIDESVKYIKSLK